MAAKTSNSKSPSDNNKSNFMHLINKNNDHIYLPTTFYNNGQANNNCQLKQSTCIVANGLKNNAINLIENDRLKSYSDDNLSINNHNNDHYLKQNLPTSIEFDDDFDEDSNDTQSYSSSSGCSSSSNSMACSVNRHLSLNNRYFKPNNTSNNNNNNNNSLATNGALSSMCQYNKDLTPRQVSLHFFNSGF